MVEAQLMIDGFDQAELYMYEQERELSVSLLTDWLKTYKFKNWTETRTRKEPVDDQMREARAEAVARILNDTDKWHSHGHGLSRTVLESDVNLIIEDLDQMPDHCEAVKDYARLLEDYMRRTGSRGTLHTVGHYIPFM